jgi:hypothetical protein
MLFHHIAFILLYGASDKQALTEPAPAAGLAYLAAHRMQRAADFLMEKFALSRRFAEKHCADAQLGLTIGRAVSETRCARAIVPLARPVASTDHFASL